MSRRSITYIEIDLPICTLTYGNAPCAALLGTTGLIKCFNSRKTCQDIANFAPAVQTIRFAVNTTYLPDTPYALPLIASVDDIEFTPNTLTPGVGLGERAVLAVTFQDGPHPDTGPAFDKYVAERDYDPIARGTFWGKFRARHPYLRGCALRWRVGWLGQDIADFQTRHFIIDSFDGIGHEAEGSTFKIIAKDALKGADDDRAQAPRLSNGFLSADITAVATSATLLPVGIGNAEYPLSGHVTIGGNEVCAFTRAGDVLTLTRARKNTVAAAHKAQDRVQLVLSFTGASVADIVYTLFTDYAGIDPSYCDLPAWQAEATAFLGTLYTADICEPTGVKTLVDELIEQAALAIWPDDLAQQIRFQVLRGIPTDVGVFTESNTEAGSLVITEQPDARWSQVQVYFGRIDPTRPMDNLDNYRSTSRTRNADAEIAHGSPAIKTIKSRWIPEAGRTVADRLGEIILARFSNPPRRINFEVMRHTGTEIALGAGYRIESSLAQDDTGAPGRIAMQITRLNAGPAILAAEADEMEFTVPAADLSNRQIVLDASNANVNLRDAHDSIYPAPLDGDTITCTINAGVAIGSISTALRAFDIGDWSDAAVTINLIVLGRLQGAGGQGGAGSIATGFAGGNGGIALYTRYPINLYVVAGQIFGGAGGGGGAGGSGFVDGGPGGGGAGNIPGLGGGPSPLGGAAASNGTFDTGGNGNGGLFGANFGGNGGGPGLAGGNGALGGAGAGGAGGAPGAAIDGISFVTVITGPGDIRGPQIN